MIIDRAAGMFSRALIVFGLACVLFYGVATIRAALYQRQAKVEVARMVESRSMPSRRLATGELIGRVDVPRLQLSAAIAEGDDDTTLEKAVGHLPETPLPWQERGNVALAAHRDGLFRKLKDIRMGDEIRVVTPRGAYSYRVHATRIVNPDDVWVVAQTPKPIITLITCYPFSYVGNAPKRFVVQGMLASEVEGRAFKGTLPKLHSKSYRGKRHASASLAKPAKLKRPITRREVADEPSRSFSPKSTRKAQPRRLAQNVH